MQFSNVITIDQSKKEMLSEMDGQYNVDDNKNVTITKVIEIDGLIKDGGYLRALFFFTYNCGNGESVIQIQEKDKGLIIGKASIKMFTLELAL